MSQPYMHICLSIIGVKQGRSWFLPAWVHSVPIDFLIECWRDLEKNGDRSVSLEPCKLQLSATNSEALKIEASVRLLFPYMG